MRNTESRSACAMVKRIAFLLPADTLAGGNLVVYQHAKILLELGHSVSVIFRNWEILRSPSADPASKLHTGVQGEPYWCRTLGYEFELLDWGGALEREFDLVIGTWWETAYEMFSIQSKIYGYFVQSDERRFYHSAERFRRAAVELSYTFPVVFITEARWIQLLLRSEFDVDAFLIPNGVSQARFHPAKPIEPKSDKLRVLIEGPSAIPYKRVALAFEVVSAVSDIEVWYVSSDGMCDPTWCPDRFLGAVAPDAMKHVYSSCDVLLKLSVVEGFFLPPLEMMACGGTTIVTDVSGHEEYVRDGYNALVVKRDDKAEAISAITRLRDDRSLLNTLQANARKTAAEMTWERVIPLYQEFLESLDNRHLGRISAPSTGVKVLRPLLPILKLALDRLESTIAAPESLYLSQREAKIMLEGLDKQFKEIVSYFALYPRTTDIEPKITAIEQQLQEERASGLQAKEMHAQTVERLGETVGHLEYRLKAVENALEHIISRLSLRARISQFLRSSMRCIFRKQTPAF